MAQIDYFKPLQALTFETVTENKSQLLTLLKKTTVTVISCDLSDIRLCDSAGLAFLIEAQRVCQGQSIALQIDHISEDIRALAKLYGVEKILKMGRGNEQ
ncbi:MAG TPA: STAS domain-containing protein [Legionellaceae bacterium]|nr:STAS domain-containing protein [Legionellaceae bacterium]